MKTKLFLGLITLLLIASCSEQGSSNADIENEQEEEELENKGDLAIQDNLEKEKINSEVVVEDYVDMINQLISEKVDWTSQQQFDLMESTEGGTLTFYFEDDKIGKIEEEHYGETGLAVNEYYFQEGEFVLIKEMIVRYNYPYYMDEYDPKLDKFYEDNTYFLNNKLIERIECEKDEDYVAFGHDGPPEERILGRLEEIIAYL